MGTDNRKGVLYAIFTASMWVFMAIVLKVITYELSPVTVVWFRFFFAYRFSHLFYPFFVFEIGSRYKIIMRPLQGPHDLYFLLFGEAISNVLM